jgi:hypothetical protein
MLARQVLYHLGQHYQPFLLYISDRDLNLCLDLEPPTYASHIAGMTGVGHQSRSLLVEGLCTFALAGFELWSS